MHNLLPNDLFGVGADGVRNREIVMRQVDGFVRLRRFESASLHEVVEGVKVRLGLPLNQLISTADQVNLYVYR